MKNRSSSYDELCQPLKPMTLSWAKWTIAGALLNSVGRLSEGVKVGFHSGFDSGRMLDYVYENKPQGQGCIGRYIDKIYLNSPGWRGIRQRKVHLKNILKEVIDQQAYHHQPSIVMDVAAGPGQYLIETVQENPKANLHVLCRDLNEEGLVIGESKAKRLSLNNIRYEKANAFERDDLLRAYPKPNVVIVSGLYELFTDNKTIADSIDTIASILMKGDYFIYTNQPFHPQLELIARILPNRLGDPWVMRLRSDQQMYLWVKQAGFEWKKTLIDEEGIFSVSLAVKR